MESFYNCCLLSFLFFSCAQYKRKSDALLINQPQAYFILGRDKSEPLTNQNIGMYKQVATAIGRMQLQNGKVCTVTQVDKGIGISSGHCINQQNCGGARIRWITPDASLGTNLSRCVEVLSWANAIQPGDLQGDYVVFSMADNLPDSFIKLNKSVTATSSDELFVISFRSDTDQVATLSPKCFFVIAQKDKDTGLSPHSCAMENGSSGALLIKQSGFTPVGIHSRGKGDSNFAMRVDSIPPLN